MRRLDSESGKRLTFSQNMPTIRASQRTERRWHEQINLVSNEIQHVSSSRRHDACPDGAAGAVHASPLVMLRQGESSGWRCIRLPPLPRGGRLRGCSRLLFREARLLSEQAERNRRHFVPVGFVAIGRHVTEVGACAFAGAEKLLLPCGPAAVDRNASPGRSAPIDSLGRGGGRRPPDRPRRGTDSRSNSGSRRGVGRALAHDSLLPLADLIVASQDQVLRSTAPRWSRA